MSQQNYPQFKHHITSWILELSRSDIVMETFALSSMMALPREGRLDAVFHMFAFLKRKHNVVVFFDQSSRENLLISISGSVGSKNMHHCAYASEMKTYERLHQDDPYAATPSSRLVQKFPWQCQLDPIPKSNKVYQLVIGNMMLELRIILSRNLLQDDSFEAMAIWLWVTYPK